MFGLRAPELIVILLIVLLLFGASRLPQLARGLGKAISEFKKGTRELEDDVKKAGEPQEKIPDSK
jgi:sec-independent protein translocase protein TatA